jgi:hypothetical protein
MKPDCRGPVDDATGSGLVSEGIIRMPDEVRQAADRKFDKRRRRRNGPRKLTPGRFATAGGNWIQLSDSDARCDEEFSSVFRYRSN